jgi:hypothetical protein
MSLNSDIELIVSLYDVKITSRSRTWYKQLSIILNPRYRKNYLRIKRRFKKQFTLENLPRYHDLTVQQRKWWKKEIMKQAGKPKGFAHVGGNAIDISVKKLSLKQKRALKTTILARGYSVYLEKITKNSARYGVSLSEANVFHIYQTN